MKSKLFLPLMTALLLSQAVMAQFHFGIKGGTNITKIQGQSFNDKFEYGYHLGGFVEIGLGGKWGIQPEVLFNQYSTSVDSSFNHVYQNALTSSDQRNVKLNYLSIPLLLNYKLIKKFLWLQAGPQFGVLINNNKTLLQNGGDAFKHGDFSLLAGAQAKLGPLRVSGRYVIGLNNINDINNQDQWKSQGFQLSVGVAL